MFVIVYNWRINSYEIRTNLWCIGCCISPPPLTTINFWTTNGVKRALAHDLFRIIYSRPTSWDSWGSWRNSRILNGSQAWDKLLWGSQKDKTNMLGLKPLSLCSAPIKKWWLIKWISTKIIAAKSMLCNWNRCTN